MTTPHLLQGRTEDELMWFRRRGFLQAAAAWSAAGGWTAAQAQARGNIVELVGDARANGRPLTPEHTVVTGDRIETGPGSALTFVIGNAAFRVRQNTMVSVERGQTLFTVSLLRLVTGAVASVWGRGSTRQIVTPTLTAGIRGTGVYAEVFPLQDSRTYFCNCYGTVEMAADRERATSVADYHQAFWGEAVPRAGRMLTPGMAMNHSDEELEYLARLVNQRTAWQLAGTKGNKDDGTGLIHPPAGFVHPALRGLR